MRVLVHDFSGHPFQVQLSRELARRGHHVLHLYSAAFETGKGNLSRNADDPATFSVAPVDEGLTFGKYSVLRRPLHEVRYGRLIAAKVAATRPDVVISSNTPLLAQAILERSAHRAGAAFVFWQQDVYSLGMKRAAEQRFGAPGALAGRPFAGLERRLLAGSDGVVPISDDFVPTLDRWRIPAARVTVIANWAPLDEIVPQPRVNAWAREQGLSEGRILLYAGTLALKHNPELLAALAMHVDGDDVRVVVVSEGPGADWLRLVREERHLSSLVILPRQPYARLSEVLGTGDVLISILEPRAGEFSVPSKVLSYHCAGRPLLGAIPGENLAARIIETQATGLVADPRDVSGFVSAASRLLEAPALRERMGARARRYAETTFDIDAVACQFETVIDKALAAGQGETHG